MIYRNGTRPLCPALSCERLVAAERTIGAVV